MVGFVSGNQLIKHKHLVILTFTEKTLSAGTAYAPCFHVGMFFDKLELFANSGRLQVQQSCRNSAVHHGRMLQSSLMPLQILKSLNHGLVFHCKTPITFFAVPRVLLVSAIQICLMGWIVAKNGLREEGNMAVPV